MGRSPRPAGPHAEGPVRVHTRIEPGPGAGLPLLPPHRAPLHLSWRRGSRCRLGRPAGPSRGRLGLSPRCSRHQASKAREGCDPNAQATNPHWGFPFPLLQCARREREGEEGTAAASSRVVTRPTGAPPTRQGQSPQPPSREEERRSSAMGKEPDREKERLRRRDRPRRREHLLHATVYPRAGHDYTFAPT
jgi:hypothetical protein